MLARADATRDAGRWSDASIAYREYLARNPTRFGAWVQLGHAEKEAGNLDASVSAYARAFAMRPQDPDLLLSLGHLAKLRGDSGMAARYYSESVRLGHHGDAAAELARMNGETAAFAMPWTDPPAGVNLSVQAAGEGRLGFPVATSFQAAKDITHSPVTDARVVIAKRFDHTPAAITALFVTHAPDGAVKPHVRPYLKALAGGGVEVLLIVATDRPLLIDERLQALTAGVMVRQNIGYDFAAWAHAIRLMPEVYDASILYLINDSMFGPNDPGKLTDILKRVQADPAEMIGLTQTHESGWHLQTYFIALKQRLIASYAFQLFINGIVNLSTKQAAVDAYEIPFAGRMVAAGFGVRSLFATGEPRNPTMHGWRELVAMGFPFVKTLLFKERFADVDIDNWRETVTAAGFDVALLDVTLKHTGVTGPVPPGFALLVDRPQKHGSNRPSPLKVALYGPWNYDNGLGSASRGLVAALRRLDVRVNLHPIKKCFHVHRPLVPAFDIADFEGDADVAIIHLNPDSWTLLTDDQRTAIARARKRIGYWVWEMSHIPVSWRENFSSVDRIWTPSAYNAALFSTQGEAAVDVIPHVVPVAIDGLDERSAGIERLLALPSTHRLILYVFDGSSYIVRKNPAALIRAFAASGLGDRGWALVLKTKHLNDRPREGAALASLAASVAGVSLVDRSMSQRDLAALLASADIYASPHCSEGFGLTVAEAMAMGKPVVATDFSGTTQYLDVSCGYPVRADRYVLEENYGHYTKGGEWARVDEAAFAEALLRAAADVDAGDRRVGDAARKRVNDALSYAAVGDLIERSLDALWQEEAAPVLRPAAPLPARIRNGVSVWSARLGEPFVICLLETGSYRCRDVDTLLRKVSGGDGQWAVFAQEDAVLAPVFAEVVRSCIAARPDVSIFYGDDVAVGEETFLDQMRCKPEFDLTLFAAQDMVGAPVVVRGSALHLLGGLDPAMGEAMLDDLILRAHAVGLSIARISRMLLAYEGKRPRVPVEARVRALAASPVFADYRVETGLTPTTLRLCRRFETYPSVTLLVPTGRSRDEAGNTYVERLLASVNCTDWPAERLRILVGDDVVDDVHWPCAFAIDRLAIPRPAGEPFNYAAKMNRLWRAADTEHVVMVNDDVVFTDPAWLKALMTFAMDDQVGGVSPRLLYDDGSIQHAGVAGGLFGVAAHAWLGRATSVGSYQDWALVHREWSMLTGAVFATRRSVLDQADGFDERFALEFNDLDLCLRIRTMGLRLVCTPFAIATHSEKRSRGGMPVPGEQMALFLRRWNAWLADDPALNPALRRDRFDLEPNYPEAEWFV